MAYLVTVKLLLDEASEEAATALAQAAINCITSQELANAETLVDSTIEDVSAVNESLDDSIANETYSEGDAFANWVLYSQSEADSDSDDNAGYWSNTYGWTPEFDTLIAFFALCGLPESYKSSTYIRRRGCFLVFV